MKKNDFQIEKLIEILTENELTELKYEEKDKIKVKIKKSPSAIQKVIKKVEKEEIKEETIDLGSIAAILSDGIGRFYYLDELTLGVTIESGKEIGYIEVMGIKTPIKSNVSGEIVEIKVENGGIVDYGKEIVKVRTTAR